MLKNYLQPREEIFGLWKYGVPIDSGFYERQTKHEKYYHTKTVFPK